MSIFDNFPDATARMDRVAQRLTLIAQDQPWLAAAEDVLRVAAAPEPAKYQHFAAIIDGHINNAIRADTQAVSDFLSLVVFYLARTLDSSDIDAGYRLSDSIRTLRLASINRILSNVVNNDHAGYRLQSDSFKKDLALIVGRLLPVGAELIQPYAGIPRGVLFQGGIRQFWRGLQYFFFQRRGFKDYCAFHMDSRELDEFNPKGWVKTYLRIAEFLELNPRIQGVFGTAWFYDPVVSKITPHLAYLRRVRETGGAQNFRCGITLSATENALAKSKRRATLYEQGQYQPEAYYLVWHRRELLRWANAQTHTEG